jgi:hypothetical protein
MAVRGGSPTDEDGVAPARNRLSTTLATLGDDAPPRLKK